MAKVGLKETLSLLAAGYKKKDIEALAAIDEELEDKSLSSTGSQEIVSDNKSQDLESPEIQKEVTTDPEPDYKKMYEELLEKNKQTEAKVTKLQQDNVHKDSAPDAAEARKNEQEALVNMVRSFM